MKERLNILIANDDGIEADGIARLAKAALEFANVWVCAPAGQCSGMSTRLTIESDGMAVKARPDFPAPVSGAWSLEGTPADCVKVALKKLLPVQPDFVLSGINDGMNAGMDVVYSGTIGAASEAVMAGIPAIAFSSRDGKNYEVCEHYLRPLLKELLEKEAEEGVIWNVNFPTCALEKCGGVKRDCFLEPHSYYENDYRILQQENGEMLLKPCATVLKPEQTRQGSDLNAVLNHYVSVGKVIVSAFA